MGALESALPQLRSLKVDGNERLRGCLALEPCATAAAPEGAQRITATAVALVVEASYTEVTDCSCPEDKAVVYPPYPPLPPPPHAPPTPPPPVHPAPPPPVVRYVYLVQGNATLEGYTVETFGSAERGWFANGIASITGMGAQAVSVTSIRATTTAGGRRLLGSGDGGRGATDAALINFVVVANDRDDAEAVIATVTAASDPARADQSLLNALISAGLSSLVGLRIGVASEIMLQQVESSPPPPPLLQLPLPPSGLPPNVEDPSGGNGEFDFSGLFGFFPWPVAAWPWIWVLRDGRWFTVVQIFTTLGTF